MPLKKSTSADGEDKKKPVKAKAKKEKAAKPQREKTIKVGKFRKGARFVLFIGDEGTILLYLKNNVVISRQFVPDASEQNLQELRASLDKDTKAPILMAIDSLDQSFVQQSLPPVSAMSVKKLIKRRLDRDFGVNDIKGAILLGREEDGRKDWNFLMVSIEKSRHIAMWLDFVYLLPNRFEGIYLVSVETEVLLKKLERAMGVASTGTGSKWKFFVSHNKVGGFRQVILRNGRIIFTRMAQPIGESTPEVIAGNIEQEMQSTIEYMKRLSFDPASGLDIYIIAGSAIKPLIDKGKFKATNLSLLTPYEMAQFLKIEGATQPTDQFGDVILAASIGSSPQRILKLSTPESQKFDNLYNAGRLQRAIGGLAVLCILGYMGSILSDIYTQYNNSEDLEKGTRQHQLALDTLRAEIKRSNLDVDKTGDILELYLLLQKQRAMPFSFIAKSEKVLVPPIIVKSLEWTVDVKTPQGVPKMVGVFTLSFPGVADIEAWRVVSKKVLADLKENFKGYDISFTKLPGRFIESEKMDLTFDSPAPKASSGNEIGDVQLTIKEM